MTEAANKELLRRWFAEVWNRGDEGVIDALFAADGIAHGLGDTDGEVRGPAQFKAFARNMRVSFPDIQISVEDMLAEADKVTARIVVEGTHLGGNLGVPASGRRVRVAGIVLVRISNGQIIEGWNSWDQLGLMQQIGALASPSHDRFLSATS